MIHGAAIPTFFQGIVEENNDPIGNGRVQIRVFGIHPPYDQNLVDTIDLPWATLLNSSYGAFHRVPNIGEWVMGISLDGQDHTNLLVLGTIPSQNRASPAGSQYAPNAYSKPNQDTIMTMGNPPIPPQMSGEDMHLTPILDNSATDIANQAITPDNQSLKEPTTPTNGNPYHTTVWNASYDGSFMEINDSQDNGYINIIHKSGTGITIDNAGSIKIKTLGDQWIGTAGNSNEYAGGRKDIVVESGNYTVHAQGGDIILKSNGDLKISSGGNSIFEASGKITINSGEGVQILSPKIGLFAHSDNIELKASNMIINEVGETYSTKAKNISAIASEDIGIQSSKDFGIISETFSASGGGKFAIDYGGKVWLNSGESDSPTITDIDLDPIDMPEPPSPRINSGTVIPSAVSSMSVLDIDDIEGMV